jgi:replication factor C large subunit
MAEEKEPPRRKSVYEELKAKQRARENRKPKEKPARISWAEKYRPQRLDDVAGNSRAVGELRRWAGDWEHGHPRKKGVILVGAPGTGKTSAALALARDMGSDSRNYASIKRVAFSGAVHDTFSDDGEYISARTGGRKLIILDEADQLYEAAERSSDGRDLGDRGGKRAIVETVARTMQPVVLIVNDSYALTSAGGESLKSLCETIKFDKIHRNVIRAALRRICDAEGISSTPEALEELAARARGDLRAAINDLQSMAEGSSSLKMDSLAALGGRDERAKIFDAMFAILKGSSIERAREAMRRLDEPPDFVLMWLDENLPLEYRDAGDLVRGFDMLSRADMFLGRVSRRQQYGLWAYASDLMSAGVAVAKHRKYHEFNKYRFPLWLVRRSRASAGRRVEKEVLGKIGAYTHMSTYMARHQMMPLVRQLFDGDHYFAVRFTRELELEQDHLAYILGVEADSPRVKNMLEAAEAGRKTGAARRLDEDKAGVSVSLGEFSGSEGDEEEKDEGPKKGENEGGEGKDEGPQKGGTEGEEGGQAGGEKKAQEERQRKIFDF